MAKGSVPKPPAWCATRLRPMSEARTEGRLGRLEEDVHEIKTTLAGLVLMLNRIDERLNTALPHLATKAELAELRTELIDRTGELGRQIGGHGAIRFERRPVLDRWAAEIAGDGAEARADPGTIPPAAALGPPVHGLGKQL